MIFDQFATFSIFRTHLLSREPMIKKEMYNNFETISDRFLMSKLVCMMSFDQFATFSILGLFFFKGTDDQERDTSQSISHVKIGF